MSDDGLHEDCCYCGTDAEAPIRHRRHELTTKGLNEALSRSEAAELRLMCGPMIVTVLSDGADNLSQFDCESMAIALRDLEVTT